LKFVISVRVGHCYASSGIRKSSYATEEIYIHYTEKWHPTTMVYNHLVQLQKIFRDVTEKRKKEMKELMYGEQR
jgi:hypothetical protein